MGIFIISIAGILCTAGLTGCSDTNRTDKSSEIEEVGDETAAVSAAAERDFSFFLERIPDTEVSAYGFLSRDELHNVRPGTPLRVHTVDVDRSGETPVVGGMRAMDEWRVPLLVEGEPRALLTVVRQGAEYKAVDFGAAGLAAALSETPQAARKTSSDALYLLRVFELRQDFLCTPRDDGDRFYPLSTHARSDTAPGGLSRAVPAAAVTEEYLDRNAVLSMIAQHVKAAAP